MGVQIFPTASSFDFVAHHFRSIAKMGEPNTNIHIAELPLEVDDEMLKEVFAAYGTVTWSRVFDSSGKPSKAAIVEFADIEEAKWCVENLDGDIPQGLSTPVKVNFKRSNNKGGGKGGWGGGGTWSYGKASTGGGKGASFSPYGK